jgi:2-C-methyl-D-erythritol 2,4-cyclodiphosphate synthase
MRNSVKPDTIVKYTNKQISMNIRIGNGYDVHQLASGLELWLGGIKIEHEKGSVAHSDGDVLIHAICDAILGAAGLRDIGYHFPDTSSEFKGIDSKILLAKTVDLANEKEFRIGNIDCVLCLQRPKVKDFIPQMIETLSRAMGVEADRVNVKATTTEKLGFVGREEGIEAYAVALLVKD